MCKIFIFFDNKMFYFTRSSIIITAGNEGESIFTLHSVSSATRITIFRYTNILLEIISGELTRDVMEELISI